MLFKLKRMALKNCVVVGIYNRLVNNIKTESGNTIIFQDGGLLTKCKIEIIGKGNRIIIEEGVRLKESRIYIHGDNNFIKIASNAIVFRGDFWIEDNDNEIVIGERTAICGETHISCIEGSKVFIGSDCLFSSDIIFRTGDSHSILDDNMERINWSKDIIIEDHVWVCNRVMVGKGVTIKKNSIIGMGAVVVKGCDKANVILAGNPAHIVKQNINWEDARI